VRISCWPTKIKYHLYSKLKNILNDLINSRYEKKMFKTKSRFCLACPSRSFFHPSSSTHPWLFASHDLPMWYAHVPSWCFVSGFQHGQADLCSLAFAWSPNPTHMFVFAPVASCFGWTARWSPPDLLSSFCRPPQVPLSSRSTHMLSPLDYY